ncbi:MAG: hypothetical protein KY462_00540 [Actinobacteria bacterium]|nr:hypothetical protein [Actinomycetota bacterium]
MEQLHVPKSESLRALYWRSEILQVMYWLRGEAESVQEESGGRVADFGDVVTADLIERFLGVDAGIGITYLQRLVDDGYLEVVGDGFRLSATGLKEGADEFSASFSDLTQPAHGDCSADCWCHASVEEAEACAAERAQHAHQH